MTNTTETALAHLRALSEYPSLLVSGTASGAIKAIEELLEENDILRRRNETYHQILNSLCE